MPDSPTSEPEPEFVCDCQEWMRSACDGEPFYNEYEGRRYCVLHFPEETKSVDFKEALRRKLNKKDFDFRGVWFPDELSFGSFEFTSEADFNRATFNADVHYEGARFSTDVNFHRAVFEGRVDFNSAVFSGSVDFSSAGFRSVAAFNSIVFAGQVDFSEATFDGAAHFNSSIFGARTDFRKAIFSAAADFSSAAFKAKAHFGIVRFRDNAYFAHTHFNAGAIFSATEFDSADFSRATFDATAAFASATFAGKAVFSSVEFMGEASFRHALFTADADFSFAIFAVGASFEFATFRADAYFRSASFQVDASFASANFAQSADFQLCTFMGSVNFSSSIFGDFARFSGNKDRHAFSGASLNLQHAIVNNSERLSFHTLTLRPTSFVNIDSRKFDFTNVEWNWLGINTEIKSLQSKDVSSPHPLLAIACRHLAVNAEENHRYEEASKFRYMAMEAQRIESWRGLAPWRLSWWYWLASGYGERVWQAFFVLLGILLLSALLYNQVGFARWEPRVASESDVVVAKRDDVGAPLKFSRALTYSAGVMILQKPEPRPATAAAQTVVLLETILGPVQAALLALAIRRKFMR
jgi:hypothetical protein